MTIQDLGSIGELVAAIATVATLAYLAFQIRQNTQQLANSARDARTSASMAIAQGDANWNLHLGLSPTSTALYFRGLASYESLEKEDKDQFAMLLSAYLNQARQSYFLHVEGVVRDDLWANQLVNLRWISAQPGFQEFFQQWKTHYADDFGGVLRELAAEGRVVAAQQRAAADSGISDSSRLFATAANVDSDN